MSKDDQDDGSDRVDSNAEVLQDEGLEETIVFTVDVGNGQQEFCLIDFVKMEESLYALIAPRDQLDDVENPEWDVYVCCCRVMEDDDIELSPVDDKDFSEQVLFEYNRRVFFRGNVFGSCNEPV